MSQAKEPLRQNAALADARDACAAMLRSSVLGRSLQIALSLRPDADQDVYTGDTSRSDRKFHSYLANSETISGESSFSCPSSVRQEYSRLLFFAIKFRGSEDSRVCCKENPARRPSFNIRYLERRSRPRRGISYRRSNPKIKSEEETKCFVAEITN
ncbi:hypothetical protein PUN28_003190 [Cardiocondyla obscurior]|uniref:Uncharacterized protein n=1 Tax=Cardiocondyla obscurior TaxID=286306 RepID=A0AAW2GNB7_9HYME